MNDKRSHLYTYSQKNQTHKYILWWTKALLMCIHYPCYFVRCNAISFYLNQILFILFVYFFTIALFLSYFFIFGGLPTSIHKHNSWKCKQQHQYIRYIRYFCLYEEKKNVYLCVHAVVLAFIACLFWVIVQICAFEPIYRPQIHRKEIQEEKRERERSNLIWFISYVWFEERKHIGQVNIRYDSLNIYFAIVFVFVYTFALFGLLSSHHGLNLM